MTDHTDTPIIKVAIGQMHCAPADVQTNLVTIESLVSQAAKEQSQLVVLPETATTGYFISERLSELAEPLDGRTASTLAALADKYSVYLAVGMVIAEQGKYYDAQLLFGPSGDRIAHYYKTHLFAAEREWYTAGNSPVVVETPIGRIGMSICYDMIFPEYIRRLVDLGADIVINSTNWITDSFQRDRWGWDGRTVTALAATRALENGRWLAMANCVGPEWVFDSVGHSCLVAPSGKVIVSLADGQGIAVGDVQYDSEDLNRWRSIASYLSDRRPELY